MCDSMLHNSSINRNIKSFFETITSRTTKVISYATGTLPSQSFKLSSSSAASCYCNVSTAQPTQLSTSNTSSTITIACNCYLSTENIITSPPKTTPPSQPCWSYIKTGYGNGIKERQKRKGLRRLYPTLSSPSSASSVLSTTHFDKWQIVVLSIIILLSCTSHVLAIRKGRLMTPSTFTALSGDLHIQIQFSPDEFQNATLRGKSKNKTSQQDAISTTTRITNNEIHPSGDNSESENFITNTLVISKYIDEEDAVTPMVTVTDNTTPTTSTSSSSSSPTPTNDTLVLQRKRKEIVQNIPVYPDPRHNVTQVAVPCQTFMWGGLYEMQLVSNLKITNKNPSNTTNEVTPTMSSTTTTTTLIPADDERLRQTLDVRWPSAEMIVSPVRLTTYPEGPVEVTLRFPEVNCDNAWKREDLPEFWLELIYCGKERNCAQLMPQNITKSSILFAEQVRGFPKQKSFKLSCDLFGLAGNYAVQLRPMIPAPHLPITRRFLSVDWSEKYVFNVYARSIFPCDPHTGIGVLYEYPSCILEQGDRVRVYAKLRADVASLKPPTSLHYIAEQRVVKNQYSLYFNCELFTEKYVEYCFVYVTQAISGAVADVRMDCVPTLPVKESDTGGWGPWSEWTPCSTNCLGGTRNRYRFCDSPPPRYGAKFCEGPSVQTEKCGQSVADTWDCIYESAGTGNKQNRTDVSQEIGPGCRCGCIVHLGASKPKRIIAGATQSCPGRSFWLLQVDGEETIALQLSFLRLPCATQYIKIRDGPSLSSTLLIELQGGGGGRGIGVAGSSSNPTGATTAKGNDNSPVIVESSGAQLLLEFFAGEDGSGGSIANNTEIHTGLICTGGFLANVEQIGKNSTASSKPVMAATGLTVKSRAFLQKPKLKTKFTLVHLSAIVFASIIILISALLGAQYVVRYRKYHLAIAKRRDEGSRLHTPSASMNSLASPPSRAISTTTLISEVIYMVKMRPKHQLRHSILRESVDAENLARETEMNEKIVKEPTIKSVDELGSTGSIVTLRNEIISPTTETLSRTPSTEDGLVNGTPTDSSNGEEDENDPKHATLKRKDSAKDSESIISSGMSSICNSPPMNTKRSSKYSERYDAATLKMTNSYMEEKTDCESLKSIIIHQQQQQQRRQPRCSSVNLTNGCYSPASSIISSATIRSTNAKESKEKQNRKKLLARPGSEFSLGNQEDFELDYYDYNVTNAEAVPGSFLGMDPAYLIWIPPFDDIPDSPERDDDKTPEPMPDENQPLYEDIKMPKYGHYLSPHSNTNSSNNTTTNTSPISDELSPLNSNFHSKATTPSETDLKNCLIRKAISSSNSQNSSKHSTPYLSRKKRKTARQQSKSSMSLGCNEEEESIPLKELNVTKSARNLLLRQEIQLQQVEPETILETDSMNGSYIEKETTVVKSPSDLQNYTDIQFADADSDESDPEISSIGQKEKQRKLSAKEILAEECKIVRDMKKVSGTLLQQQQQQTLTMKRTQV
ncbi:thrombospondin-1 like protein golden goal [Musca autumnalis]|uniref:thrombospondin-1 like protein golden goal n=1 Tax=Musca autumnalis TaxID=221902 RepID=UPI003CEE8207